jgi:hypothetical protein
MDGFHDQPPDVIPGQMEIEECIELAGHEAASGAGNGGRGDPGTSAQSEPPVKHPAPGATSRSKPDRARIKAVVAQRLRERGIT